MSVRAWCCSNEFPEDLAEITLAAKTNLLADLRNGYFLVHQHVLCFGDSETRYVRAKRLAHRHFEESHEMR